MINPDTNGFYIQWHILDRCNLRCVHCYQEHFSRERELDWEGLKQTADNLLDTMKIWNTKLDAALTGGEPFLKPELFQLLEYLDKSEYTGDLCIISNGTIWPDYAQELTELSKFNEIRISLDGITETTNDLIRGKNSFSKTLENISRWKKLGIPVTLMFTVMKRNLHEIRDIIAFGEKLGIDGIIIERFFPLGQGEEIEKDTLNGPEFVGVWKEVLRQIDIEIDPSELAPFRAIRINFDEEGADVLGSGCVVGKDGMALLPDGTVLPCRRFTLPIGNIIQTPLHDIWKNSKVLDAIQDKTKLEGKCGSCTIDECQGCRAMCYCLLDNYLAEDPHCFIVPPEF